MERITSFLLFFFTMFSLANAQLPGLIPYHGKDRLWGYSDSTRKIIIPCQFSSVSMFDGKDSARVRVNQQYGYVMKNGDFHPDKPVDPNLNGYVTLSNSYAYNYVWNFDQTYTVMIGKESHGLYIFQDSITSLYGFRDYHNEIVIDAKYREAQNFSEGLAFVKDTAERCWFIDRNSRKIISMGDKSFYENFSKGRAIVSTPSGYGVIDKKGKYIVLPVVGYIYRAGHFFILSSGDESPGMLVDFNGKPIDNRVFDEIRGTGNGLWLVRYGDHYGFLNEYGKSLTSMDYIDAHDFYENRAAICREDGKWGFIDSTGKEVIPPQFSDIHDFQNGLAMASDSGYSGNFGFIDPGGKRVIPFIFGSVERDFDENGLALIYYLGYIDKYGTRYWDEELDQ